MQKITRVVLVCLVFGMFTACETKDRVKPHDFIEQGAMVMVLKDICIVEARFQRRLSIPGMKHGDLVFENYKIIFETHDVSIDQFKSSYSYYEEFPELMQQMYDSVIVVLSKEESELKSTGDANHPKKAN